VNEEDKKKIDIYVRDLEDIFPAKDTVYHYYVDSGHRKLKHWEDMLSASVWKYDAEYGKNITLKAINLNQAVTVRE